jgi:hypothetical protein
MLKTIKTLLLALITLPAICGEVVNFSIGEFTVAQDYFLRKHITNMILQDVDKSATLEKMSLEDGLKKLQSGEINFLIVNDTSFLAQYPDLDAIKYNSVYLGVIVNKLNPLKEIKFDDLKKIFTNKEKSWNFLIPGNKYSIHRFGNDENSAAYQIACRIFPATQGQNNSLYYPIKEVALMVESNEHAIGLIELSTNNNSLRKVKLLPIINTNDTDKPQLDFYLIFKKDQAKSAKDFLSNG